MPEGLHPHQERNFKELREQFFEALKRDTRIMDGESYQELYKPARQYWGVDSPAFVFPKAMFPRHPNPEIIPQDIEGSFLIAIDRDSVPDPDYIKYLMEHEYSELYVGVKPGFNLSKVNKMDFGLLPILERRRPTHRVAVLKEFQMAQADGKLDAYMDWWREFYQKDVEAVRSMPPDELERISKNYQLQDGGPEPIVRFIESNLQLREEIYEKVKAGTV